MENSTTQPLTGSKWSLERRLQFIDFRLRWEGRLNRRDLIDYFAISVPQASMDISKYNELAPGNLTYDMSSRTYMATEAFKALYNRSNSQRYLTELWATRSGLMEPSTSFIGKGIPVDFAPAPERSIPDETVHVLVSAIREKRKVAVTYQSMSSITPTARELSPHALGHDGFRWHTRAFCHTKGDFRDFVIGRMLSIELSSASDVEVTEDRLWNNIVTLVIVPNPELSEGKKRVLELDYGMSEGRILLPCRQAFLFYTLKRLGLKTKETDNPAEQQICLHNRSEIQAYIDEALSTGGS
jgi:predicted DNA-binding transcriptional regulator YafY